MREWDDSVMPLRRSSLAAPGRATFGEVLRAAESRVLLVAQARSRVGDQLARTALALLVLGRTPPRFSPGMSTR